MRSVLAGAAATLLLAATTAGAAAMPAPKAATAPAVPAAPAVLATPAVLAAPPEASPSAAPDPSATPPRVIHPTDYADPAHWLALPAKPDKPVDVFFVYPTTYKRATPESPLFAAIDDPGMVAGAMFAYAGEASVFAPFANIYAPYYRQVDATYTLSLNQAGQAAMIGQEPDTDVFAAFDHYVRHWNHGRPFILLSHSQGSAVVRDLLSRYMKTHPRLYARMVAAYVVGQSITPAYLAASPYLRFATGEDDTGVIVSWNTEAPVIAAPNPVTEPGGIAINPITWTRDETEAYAFQSLGAITRDPSGGGIALGDDGQPQRVVGLADARVDLARGVVICSSVDPAAYKTGFPEGVYHSSDFLFYYFDIRANGANRIDHFLAAHPEFRRD